jgi:DNA-binding NarL/FixJ family response regulator
MEQVRMRVLIVEDSGYLTDSLMQLLGLLPALTVVGQATSRAEALRAASAQRPDLVILDLRIKDTADGLPNAEHGLATLRDLQHLEPSPRVLVLTSLPEQHWLRPMAQAGALGFVSKDDCSAAIITALQALAAGMAAFTPAQLQILRAPAITLSRREQEVLILLAEGLSNQALGERLGISVGTVRKHVEGLGAAFDVHSRGQVVAAARRERLLPSEG